MRVMQCESCSASHAVHMQRIHGATAVHELQHTTGHDYSLLTTHYSLLTLSASRSSHNPNLSLLTTHYSLLTLSASRSSATRPRRKQKPTRTASSPGMLSLLPAAALKAAGRMQAGVSQMQWSACGCVACVRTFQRLDEHGGGGGGGGLGRGLDPRPSFETTILR